MLQGFKMTLQADKLPHAFQLQS